MDLTTFEAELKNENRPVLVEFWAPWCAPCRMMAPALDLYGQKYAAEVTLRKVNADENPELVRALKVMAIPTMLVYQGGAFVQRRVGAQSPQQLHQLFEKLAQGETQPEALPAAGMDPVTRILRLATGLLLIMFAIWFSNWWLGLVGGAVAFWGWYDRCPIWQALAPRLKALIKNRSFS